MTAATEAPTLVRVIRGGDIPDAELAALTAVLLARAAAQTADAARDEVSVMPLWERPGHRSPYRSPLSWRS
ncbi:acyl-CoA carboxylase epsilon subunit [Streptomyces sp. NPDC058470]|uniref:acyl-CoA carboxylase epsilon subunit n=1 Tax=Streptomyces sp. NPDC058470 TaxID=3346515 RepID=UPI003666B94F